MTRYDGPCVNGPMDKQKLSWEGRVYQIEELVDPPPYHVQVDTPLNYRTGQYVWNKFGAFWDWKGWNAP